MGQSNSILQSCEKIGVDVTKADCAIEFNSSGDVVSFGNVTRGHLEADTDIAGQGVLIAFLVPGVLLVLCGLIFALARAISFFLTWRKQRHTRDNLPISEGKSSAWLHEHLDDFICSLSDAQLLVILAFGAAFYSKAQCSISTYHYTITIHLVLAGLAASLLALILIRKPQKKIISMLLRIAMFSACLAGLLGQKDVQGVDNTSSIRSQLPGMDQRDSTVVLPTFCLLDDSLNPFPGLTAEEKKHLINKGLSRNAVVQSRFLLAFFILVALFKHILGLRQRWGLESSHKVSSRCCGCNPAFVVYIMTTFCKFAVWAFSLILICYNWLTVFLLRDWVERSGWLELEDGQNPERDVQGLGQIAPLIALGAIGFTITDTVSEFLNNWWKKTHPKASAGSPNSIQLQPVNSGHSTHGYTPITP
ncbi:hypothetical protein B0T10DRAFT_574861 [Thelonectria olida]|uniref:Uncharacterized protein n=1 Tax=Thelonectria olida TaxID=1576542 RepID=A0A9P8W2I2_9HYPO|nr:hypothetical protein B0T10DRAFT_574861 [Thelonectria olida]